MVKSDLFSPMFDGDKYITIYQEVELYKKLRFHTDHQLQGQHILHTPIYHFCYHIFYIYTYRYKDAQKQMSITLACQKFQNFIRCGLPASIHILLEIIHLVLLNYVSICKSDNKLLKCAYVCFVYSEVDLNRYHHFLCKKTDIVTRICQTFYHHIIHK